MNPYPARPFRRLACVSAGLLSIPLALFTLILFVATGHPIPSAFIPADRLNFHVLPGDTSTLGTPTKPILLGVGSSRRCMSIMYLSLKTRPDGFMDVLDSVSMQNVYRASSGNLPHYSELSLGREYLFIADDHGLHLFRHDPHVEQYHEISGWWKEPKEPDIWPEPIAEAAVDNRHLLVCKESTAINYDLQDGRKVAAFTIPAKSKLLTGFFDSSGSPKCLVYSLPEGKAGRLEIRDLQTANLELTLDQSKFDELGIVEDDLTCANSRISPRRSVIATCLDPGNLLVIRSLANGRTRATFLLPPDTRWLGTLSSDDRFFLYGTSKKGSQLSQLEGWNELLDSWLKQHYPNRNWGTLLDIQNGATWTNLIIGDRNDYAFSEDGSRLISYTTEGRYEYDLPPKWQYFTPWAWASLGAWLGVITFCRQLRQRRRQVLAAGQGV
ncbi:hypothetical protein BH10PLA2_BH10PLA2_22280 [soil metagenome]